ncbi:MAG: DUF2341 domain-containing protein, partial [Bacteroidales bacterium]|nr:DUF2341 domain-containing protein [Bacteroidales bacterium]
MIYKKNIYHRINIIAFSLFVLIINISRNTYSQCTITCPPDTNFFTLPGVNYAITDTLLPFESGGCMPGFTYTLSGSTAGSGDTVINDTFNLGLTKVTYTIDGHSCSFNVNVLDMEPPEIEGVENISTTANPNDCGAQIYFDLPTITDNTEDVTPIVQYFDFNASSIDNLTSIGWKFENISLFPADTCLRSNTLSTSDNFYSTSPFYYFNSDDSVFFVHWITDPSGPNTDSLKLYLINTNNDTALIFSYASLIADIKNTDTIVISTSGFYRLHFVYQTESGGTARGFLDNIFVQGIYAHNINLENIIEPVEALRIFQLDSTYISGDVFPIGKTVIQYKIIDNYGNYSLKEFTITISGGGNIISGNSIVDENTVHLYTTTSGMTNYNWTITGGIEYDGNGDDSIYIFWNSGPNGHVRVSYDNGPTHVISCNFSVAINDIDYGCFEYKRKLTINSALVMADLENFPVLVYTTLPEFKHTSYGGHISHFNGYDISFSTDSNGFNILPHQLDYYEPSTGKIAIWVMFSELDGDANTNFYMHYGNSNIDRDISNDTIWSSDWVGVFHMGQSLNDYGRGNNNSVNYGTDQVDGKVGKARRFRRTDKDYISIINKTPFSFTTSMTVSFWIYLQSYPTASGVDWTDIIIKGDNQNWRFVGNKSTQRMCYAFNLGGEGFDTYSDNNSFTTGHWYYVAGTWESQNDSYQANNIKKLFFNGDINTQDPSHTPNNSISDDSDFDPNDPVIFGINNDATDTRSFDGMMDEIRLANTYRNDAWLQTDFNTQSNPGSFITFSEEESGTVVSSIGGFADIDQDTIYAREFVTGNLTGQIGTIQWQWSSDKSTFYDIEGATSSSFLSEPVLEDTYIRALVSNRGCAKSSTIDSVSVIAGFITCEYNFRRELVISPDSVDGTDDLLNFPFLIEFNQPYMRDTVHGGDVINSSGWDIIFTSSNGISIIPHEVDVYDPVTGHYRAWVKIPRLKSTDTTYFYMYYGKEGVITNPSTRSPWSSEYIGVWHLENNCRDTVGTNEGTVTSGTASYSTAKIGNGINMNGVTVTIANESNFDIPADKAITISGWFNISSFSSSNQPLISKGTDAWELRRYGTNPYGEFIIELDGSGKYYSAQGNTSFLSGWKYICASYDDLSRQYVIYVNGVLASATNDPADPKNRLTNNTPITFRSFLGYLDELRIANVYRSIDWIKTEYRNQMNPDSMFLVREPRQFCVANPVGGTTFSDDTVVCKGRNAVIILSNSDGNVYWQQSADSIDWEFMLGETDTILVTDVLSDTMFYRAVVSEECCSDYSEIIQINFKNQNPPDLNIFVNNIACAGDDNGIIDIVPSTDDYLYHWSTNATTEDITNLEPGTYSVTVVDTSSKCNLKENRTINESERINITLSDLDDVTCNGNDGAINIAVAGGTLPYLINFDSIHYVKIGDNDSLDNLINIEGSIEVRFKTKDTTRQGSILYKGSNSSNHSYDISLTEDSLIFIYSYSGGTHTLSWDSIEINQWYHVAIDWDENNLRMYINGDLKDYEGKTGHNLDATNDSLYIGKKGIHPNSSREYFWGNIKDVRIWNRSRTKENITDSMKIPLLGSESGLLAYYPMDEHNQDSIFNNTTNENIHGQIYPTSNITWIASTYEYLWSNDILVQDIISLDTGYYSVTVSDIYGCFETRQFYVDFDDAIKVAPTSPLVTIEGLRFGAGPQILKVKGPYNNCPDSAVRYVWYIEDIPGTQTINNKSDSLLVVYQGSSQTYYVASVNFAGTESETRTSVPAALNALDSN